MPFPKPCVIANWKMQSSWEKAQQWMAHWQTEMSLKPKAQLDLDFMDIVVCPPTVYLQALYQELACNLQLGAQNTFCEEQGAYTGEVSAVMLKEVGCRYVLVGHSERRTLFLESDALVAKKFKAAYDAGLSPVLCVGETRAERETDATLSVIQRQLDMVFDRVDAACFKRAIIAYEPVWAIGTGLTATPEQAEEVHAAIRKHIAAKDPELALEIRLLYGGSVKAANAAELFSQPNIDGGLVGGASLDPQEFFDICHCVKGII
jgi:triosephosphate isomerase